MGQNGSLPECFRLGRIQLALLTELKLRPSLLTGLTRGNARLIHSESETLPPRDAKTDHGNLSVPLSSSLAQLIRRARKRAKTPMALMTAKPPSDTP